MSYSLIWQPRPVPGIWCHLVVTEVMYLLQEQLPTVWHPLHFSSIIQDTNQKYMVSYGSRCQGSAIDWLWHHRQENRL